MLKSIPNLLPKTPPAVKKVTDRIGDHLRSLSENARYKADRAKAKGRRASLEMTPNFAKKVLGLPADLQTMETRGRSKNRGGGQNFLSPDDAIEISNRFNRNTIQSRSLPPENLREKRQRFLEQPRGRGPLMIQPDDGEAPPRRRVRSADGSRGRRRGGQMDDFSAERPILKATDNSCVPKSMWRTFFERTFLFRKHTHSANIFRTTFWSGLGSCWGTWWFCS